MELYVFDPKNYHGGIITTIEVNDISELETAKCRYSKRILSKLKQQYGDGIIALTWDEYYEQYDSPYKKSLQTPFKEITAEQWEDMLNCLPPMKWHDFAAGLNVFFCSEAYTGDLHGCYIKDRTTGKFYTALRSRFISDEQLFNDFKECIK
jgi:hypothetical protein